MRILKIFISKIIWKFCGISPKTGDMIIDILGCEKYDKVMRYQRMSYLRKENK